MRSSRPKAALTAAENSLHLLGINQGEIERLVKTGEINPPLHDVRAPMGGAVIKREVTLGENVGPEREALLVLADMTTLWVLADVPENTIHQIAPGAPGDRRSRSAQGPELSGKSRLHRSRARRIDAQPARCASRFRMAIRRSNRACSPRSI